MECDAQEVVGEQARLESGTRNLGHMGDIQVRSSAPMCMIRTWCSFGYPVVGASDLNAIECGPRAAGLARTIEITE